MLLRLTSISLILRVRIRCRILDRVRDQVCNDRFSFRLRLRPSFCFRIKDQVTKINVLWFWVFEFIHHDKVLVFLGDGETVIDEMIAAFDEPASKVLGALVNLEMRRLVRQLPGKRVVGNMKIISG